MGQNWKFDPVKRDYVLEQGRPVATDRIEETVYFVLMIPRGQWIYGLPGQGSELFKFVGAKRVASTDQLFAARAIQAIESQVIAQGRARQVETRNLESTRTGTSNQITVVPLESELSAQFKLKPV
jgi:hypothetical protein